MPPNHWVVIGFLALGFATARLAGLRKREWLDLPSDGRIDFALFTGFLVRGSTAPVSAFAEFGRIFQWRL
jgi:hypothetical protein